MTSFLFIHAHVGSKGWWFTLTVNGPGIRMLNPTTRKLFSERHGIVKPFLSVCGYRFFTTKKEKV